MQNLPPELHSMLLGRRVIFVRGRLDDNTANAAIAQLLVLGQTAPGQPIEVYLDAPSGSLAATMALYDVIQSSAAPVSITCLGTTGGAAVQVHAGGASGRRFALPHSRLHLTAEPIDHDTPTGNAEHLTRTAQAATKLQATWLEALARHSAHSPERIARDLAAGLWLSAAEARDYGLVDGIIPGAPALGALRPG
jgi:ATP-dependent Clp protease protease subunit